MPCEYCRGEGYHVHRCPNYSPLKATRYCSICEEGIYDEEEYIENMNGECIHYECINSIRGLFEFLGYEVKTWKDY